MNLLENIRLALEGLRANKMRALLTMLGIIIGIASVMAISTLGSAMTGSVSKTMDKIGGKNISVYLTPKNYDSQATLQPEDYITQDELNSFKETYADQIRAISLSSSLGSGKLNSGYVHKDVSVTGANPDYRLVNNINLVQGRFISDRDIQSSRNVIIIDTTLRNNLVGVNGDPTGMDITVETKNTNETYTIIGVYEKVVIDNPLFNMGDDTRIECFIPITTAKALNSQSTAIPGYENFTIMASANTDTTAFAQITKQYFIKNLGALSDYTIEAQSMEAMVSEATSMLSTLSLGISVIAGISLLVGGIGVMNIMLVSVTERTKEIGIRKALGARNSAIRSQFIIEAIIICLIGGIIGVGLGSVLGVLGSSLLKFPTTPPFTPMIIALCFSMGIGVFFGYYPANKAAKLDPIDALRYE
ncbi:FtsX-like permease family protein [Acetobacterium paludosum]|uniref:FtsX-like permease family protein n=1 Tax=Acetobacterium paludosum TaxID=52693 RepID=A0A923HXF6_9FIRM|nr:ABC transporter permease [Acetobacterium paludosum]MBC3887756.1 FtsX-like permease family protein [Acetobacterium paludosum]